MHRTNRLAAALALVALAVLAGACAQMEGREAAGGYAVDTKVTKGGNR